MNTKYKLVKLMTDVGCYSLWVVNSDSKDDVSQTVHPDEVLKDADLINDILAWDQLYQDMMEPIMKATMTPDEHDKWCTKHFDDSHDEQGLKLAQRIANELNILVECFTTDGYIKISPSL